MKKMFVYFYMVLVLFSASYAGEMKQYTLTTVGGKELHIHDIENGLVIDEYRGKIVFLEFWGSHCPPCLFMIPKYIELYSRYKDRLAIVAIEAQTAISSEDLKQFADERGINYDLLSFRGAEEFIAHMQIRSDWEGALPFLMIFDREGKIVTMQLGALREEGLAKLVESLSTDKKSPPQTERKASAPGGKESNTTR